MPETPPTSLNEVAAPPTVRPGPSRHAVALLLVALAAVPAIYVASAYEFVPAAWRIVERRHPALEVVGTRAFTSAGIPGDPLNIAFVGTEAALHRSMLQAGWFPADPITLHSSFRIAADSVAHKPYADAPVSNLFLYGRRQDLAFEQAANGDPSKRHHVRFWLTEPRDAMNRTLWIGAATYDSGVGLSHTTGQITHHIAPAVDEERDKLLADLQRQGNMTIKWIEEFQTQHEGRNGGGDRFITDGKLLVIEGTDSPSAH